MDRFSPFAPACIRVVVLPAGTIARDKFLTLIERLQKEAAVVSLADVAPHVNDDDILLAPKSFLKGSLLYNHTTTVPDEQHTQLSPFELFREPLLVLGVVDLQQCHNADKQEELKKAAELLRERHPRVVDRQLLAFGDEENIPTHAAANVVYVGSSTQVDTAPIKEAICKVSAHFLKELSTYSKALQASPSIQTPGQTARVLQRTISQRESERRPGSASGTSTPSQSNDTASPVDDNPAKQPPWSRGSPATSFDQIPTASAATSTRTARPDSRSSNRGKQGGRASSQDRISVQGFGTSLEKNKQRGKARVGIVTGSIYLMAGQWSEAMRLLKENTNKARILGDHVWHGKGLEYITVCLLLHSWSGLEFQIPSVCYPLSGGPTTAGQRFSVNLPSEFKTTDIAQQASVRTLSTSLPDLLKLIVSLYRSGEGPVELPFLPVSEAAVRFGKVLAVLHTTNGELGHSNLDRFIGRADPGSQASRRTTLSGTPKLLSRAVVSDMMAHALPSVLDFLLDADRIAILAGIASVYSIVHMDRKKAMVLTEMVTRVTDAIIQAQKRTPAELGGPAVANLTEAGASLAPPESGLNGLIEELGRIYGFDHGRPEAPKPTPPVPTFFGSDTLKLQVLKELGAMSEALLDTQGLSKVESILFGSFVSTGAIDSQGSTTTMPLFSYDQAAIAKGIASSKDMQDRKDSGAGAVYTDSFMLRGVELLPPAAHRAFVDGSVLRPTSRGSKSDSSAKNPLLYDPSASRPGTAVQPDEYILVVGEEMRCLLTLQNPFDFPVNVQSLHLVTKGAELGTQSQSFELPARKLFQVPFSIVPSSPGHCQILGCKVKLAGHAEQFFQIYKEPWVPAPSTLLKGLGQESKQSSSAVDAGQQDMAAPVTISAEVIEAQPLLEVECDQVTDSKVMLLDGEKFELEFFLTNVSAVPAKILGYAMRSAGKEWPAEAGPPTILGPDESMSWQIELGSNVFDKAGKSNTFIFFYGREGSTDTQLRQASQRVEATVNAGLEIRFVDVVPNFAKGGALETEDEGSCLLGFDMRNAWAADVEFSIPEREFEVSPPQRTTVHPGAMMRAWKFLERQPADAKCVGDVRFASRALQRLLRANWTVGERSGAVVAPPFLLSPRALVALTQPPVGISVALRDAKLGGGDLGSCHRGSFVYLEVGVTNRTAPKESLFVELDSPRGDLGFHGRGGGAVDSLVDCMGEPVVEIARLERGEKGKAEFVLFSRVVGEVMVRVSVATLRPEEFGPRMVSRRCVVLRVV